MRFYKFTIFLMSVFFIHTIFSLDFIDKDLNAFIERVVDPEYHKEFLAYYEAFIKSIDQLGKNNPSKKRHELNKVRNNALWSLENNNPDWALQIKPYLHAVAENGDQKNLIDAFLVRYGVYQEFLKSLAKQRASLWYRVKSYSRHVGSKIVNFFMKPKEPLRA